ncbi:hypothetical protein ACH4U6_05415 [Streptomyces netropsis]|uniref:hypothetical protein n=1 Tax=Streptomyces netropsis TaxID=55404 RepID=UPI0037B63AAD
MAARGATGLPRPGSDAGRRAAGGAALLLAALLLLMVVRLPWAGDLGMHAAVLERLRTDLPHPGNPLVDAHTPSPYYSPWTVLLAVVAEATGWHTFPVLRLAAFVGLVLLVTGVGAFVVTFTRRAAAVPLALLCVLLLYGVRLFAWSGFPGLTSLSLSLAYPSTFALGLALHFLALLRRALGGRTEAVRGLPAFLALGALLACVLLSHQFTGAVAVLGAAAMLLGARPWPDRAVWARVGVACVLTLVVLALWPYYPFYSLPGAGGLDDIHRPLYDHLAAKFCLVGLGVVALMARWGRDRRDPLAIFFVLGLAVFAAGGLSGHHSWGRILPAVLLPAQLALAIEVADAGADAFARRSRAVVPAVAVTTLALLAGAWTQAGVLTYVLRDAALPPVLRDVHRIAPWPSFAWAARHVPKGATVMTDNYFALRMLPAYGPYTVAPAYPDFFLPDERRRREATRRYFDPATARAERLGILKEYGARWVVQRIGGPGLPEDDPSLRKAAQGPGGLALFEVAEVGRGVVSARGAGAPTAGGAGASVPGGAGAFMPGGAGTSTAGGAGTFMPGGAG